MADEKFNVNENNTKKRILIVDDSEKYCSALKRKLLLHGFQNIVTTDSPEPVLGMVGLDPMDVILLDIYMRDEEKAGINLLRAIRERGHRMLIAMVSGDDSPETFVEAIEAGADDYWLKGRYLNIEKELEDLFARPSCFDVKRTPLMVTSLGYLRTLNFSEEEVKKLTAYAENLERRSASLSGPLLITIEKPAMSIVLKIFSMLMKP
jgi:PleD family two-component response regulator